jgi:formate hydrogenlyase transcriptional activator
MQCDAVGVSLLEPSLETTRLRVLDFPGGKGFLKEDEVLTIGRAGKRVLETLKPTIANLLDPADYSPEIYEMILAEGFTSHGLIPLVNRGRPLGFLSIARTTGSPFTENDVEFLSQAAGQIAIAIENALAYKKISELKDKLAQEKLYLEEEIRSDMNFENIVGNSPTLKHVLELV